MPDESRTSGSRNTVVVNHDYSSSEGITIHLDHQLSMEILQNLNSYHRC